jgi:CPA2 family monovalent cation:H+ antiporter-2
MEEITLLRDFAIIMVVAGAVTLLFRKLRQPVILGYLIAGLIVGPYTLPIFNITDIHNIRLLADLGLVLILFGMGLEFSWSKIRHVGFSILMIGVVEIVTMISLGYGLGQLLGWSTTDSIFLGAALHISSSAIIVKLLRDMGKLQNVSSRLIVGILVVEDFAAVTILALLSGLANTGMVNFGDVGFVILKLVFFTIAALVLGAVFIPRIINFTHRLHSNEALLITSLGLCFAMALFGQYLGLSVAIGAFLMGSLIGDTEHSEDVVRILAPVRHVFAALFFVAIGMLINITQFRDYAVQALIVAAVFIFGKILINTIASFLTGQSGKVSLRVGMGMPQMGEFSLVITRVGVENKIVIPHLYPVIALVTAITAFTSPYIMRSSDYVADFLERNSPPLLKTYVARLADWLKALGKTFGSDSIAASIVRHAIRTIVINLLILIILIGGATFALPYASNVAAFLGIRNDIIVLIMGCLLLLFCLPSFIIIWQNIRNLTDYAVTYLLSRRLSSRSLRLQTIRTVFRDSVIVLLTILIAVWFIPLMLGIFSVGSLALAVPAILIALFVYIILWSAFDIHGQMERTFSRVLIGKEQVSTSRITRILNIPRNAVNKAIDSIKKPLAAGGREKQVDKTESKSSSKKKSNTSRTDDCRE